MRLFGYMIGCLVAASIVAAVLRSLAGGTILGELTEVFFVLALGGCVSADRRIPFGSPAPVIAATVATLAFTVMAVLLGTVAYPHFVGRLLMTPLELGYPDTGPDAPFASAALLWVAWLAGLIVAGLLAGAAFRLLADRFLPRA